MYAAFIQHSVWRVFFNFYTVLNFAFFPFSWFNIGISFNPIICD